MPDSTITREFVAELPKTDLHVHLDGSLRIPTLIELAREQRVELPSYTEAGLRETVYKDRYTSLGDYLKGFRYTVAVMQTPEALERIAAELAEDNQAEGVRYLEVRFAPQLHVRPGLDAVQVLAAVDRGLRRARDAYNRRPEIAVGREPAFEYGIICSALRMFGAGFSQHY
ncbi:MAG: adenosine deaminase family protein, partial [Steroidobacteraceae bacterium]